MSESLGSSVAGTTEAVTDSSVPFAASPDGRYASDWHQDSNHKDHDTVFDHKLGVIPNSVLVLFTADKKTAYPIHWSWKGGEGGNPVTISMDATTITLSIHAGASLHGVWDPKKGWTQYTDGYWKVIATA